MMPIIRSAMNGRAPSRTYRRKLLSHTNSLLFVRDREKKIPERNDICKSKEFLFSGGFVISDMTVKKTCTGQPLATHLASIGVRRNTSQSLVRCVHVRENNNTTKKNTCTLFLKVYSNGVPSTE